MFKITVMLLIFSSLSISGLIYLDRSTEAETLFETPPTIWSNPGDDDTTSVSIGFTFDFNNNSYNSIIISSNGTLSFISNSNTYNNTPMDDSSSDDFNIFPYWEDLNPPQNGTIKYGLVGSGATTHFVVSYDNVARYRSSGSLSFQVVLYQNGSIRFRYLSGSDADGTYVGTNPGSDRDGGTVGIKEDSNHYDQYIFDETLDQTLDVLYIPIPPPSSNDYSDWHFDELGWSGVADEVRDSHWDKHGEGYSVASVRGKLCQAMDLTPNSKNDYAELDVDIIYNLGDFTASIWVQTTQTDSSSIFTGANGSNDIFQLWITSNQMQLWLNDTTRPKVNLPSNFANNQWHHIVWRRDSGQMCIFFDGIKTCPSHTIDTSAIQSTVLYLGQETDDASTTSFSRSQDYEGLLDEFIIFRKALSDSEIGSIYNNQNSGKNWDGTDRVCPYPSLIKTSCVINDPINTINNPKRIPGSTIRYALEVRNPNTTTIEGSSVDDNISIKFDDTTITLPKIVDGSCDNCIGLSGGSSGSSSVNNNEVTIDIGDVTGGTLSSPTKRCGYFDVDLK